jgi:uncharacterized protein (DUF302 family)
MASKQFPSHIHMIAGSRRSMVQVRPIDIDRHDDAANKQEAAMIDSFTVQHCEHVSQRSFEAVVAAFEAELGSVEDPAIIPREVAAATSQADFEARIKAYEGRSGFMRFLTNDHGAWMSRVGVEAKIRSYIIGNPLIAQTMITHDPGVGLNVPIRVVIYQTASGEPRLGYDLPSSLMSRLHNDDVSAAALNLDAKLRALAVFATGAAA